MLKVGRLIASINISLCLTTMLSFVVLTSSGVRADSSSSFSVTVPVACTVISTVDTEHAATIYNGTYQEDIGKTTFKTVCNDGEGYSIYAVGYSNNEFGNTKMLATINNELMPTHDIETGTATSGVDSAWAMKLSSIAGISSPSILRDQRGSFADYHAVPSEYTKVATFTAATDVTEGSSIQTTYRVYIDSTKPAGSYNGKVRYTMVHPASERPVEPVVTNPGYISYNPNAAGVTDTMGDQSISNIATSADLWASNFKRAGYGFAGWNDKFDYTGNNYGPNETISFTAGQYSGDNKGLSLYAVWVKSAGDLQGWTGCSALNTGDVTALTDTRDNQTYAIAKLADGNCWMIENLRLDNEYTTGSANEAKAQGYAKYSGTGTDYGDFIGLADPENTLNWNYSTTANSLYYSGTQSGTATIDIGSTSSTYPGYRFPRYNNQNTASPATNMTAWDNNANTYSVGNWYTWSAAMANTKYYSSAIAQVDGTTSETAGTSICPTGWKLPYGRNTGSSATSGGFSYLDIQLGGTGASQSGTAGTTQSAKWRSYPNNFIYSGSFGSGSPVGRGSYGYYWSSTVSNNYNSCYLGLGSSYVYPGTYSIDKYFGRSIRCLSQ